jgi:uncharacterized membrane protein
MSAIDRLVHDYLQAVERAAADLSEPRRRELIEDLNEHIAAERAALDAPTETDIRAILDRLGDPATLAGEARALDDGPRVSTPVPAGPRRMGPLGWVLMIVGSVVLVCFLLVAMGFALFATSSTEGTGSPETVESVLSSPTS